VTVAAFRAAKKRGIVTILNPAPYQELSRELLDLTDWIVPNETEFLELHPERLSPDSEIALTTFRPGKKFIVTLGGRGAALVSESGDVSYISAPVLDHVIDTTGAGDAFVGTFASSIGRGEDGIVATNRACKVASLSVMKKGAQSSYPTPEELSQLE
jgi:ribokinase